MAAGAMDVFDALSMACAAAAAGRMSRAQCVSVACDVTGAAGIIDMHAGEFGKMLVLQNSASHQRLGI